MTQLTADQLNKLTAAIPGVVYQFAVSAEGKWRFLYLSPGIEMLFEVDPEAAYRDHSVMTRCILEEDRPGHRASVEQATRALSVWRHEHRIRTRSGAVKWVRGQATPELQVDGSVVWSGILTDITASKGAETHLEAQLEELRRWQRLTQGREDRIIELKREVNELLQRTGQPIRYPAVAPAPSADEP